MTRTVIFTDPSDFKSVVIVIEAMNLIKEDTYG